MPNVLTDISQSIAKGTIGGGCERMERPAESNAREEAELIETIRRITQGLEQADCDKVEAARLLEEALNQYAVSRKTPK
ncbi:MAG TPA: hypothetical protein PKA10_00960 [Selenomonadales bacterium]|nr:hypothetical protein [Selenomonadales bacterium]